MIHRERRVGIGTLYLNRSLSLPPLQLFLNVKKAFNIFFGNGLSGMALTSARGKARVRMLLSPLA